MTLSFKQEINGKPTYFPEKVLLSLSNVHQGDFEDYHERFPQYSKRLVNIKPKLHTIRVDKSDRWKAMNVIHFVVKNRTPYRYQFAPRVHCRSVQKIRILYGSMARFPVILVDGKKLNRKEYVQLAENDGFSSFAEFTEYFSKDFEGKIIHWTDLMY